MIGATLSHFKITAKLGEGGMGEVYRAEDTELERQVALKVLPEEMASDPDRLERFRREAKTVATLNHPNIVTIYSVAEADGIHFLTMELVEGKTLGELISSAGVSLDRFLALATPIADALATAHGRGIVHRDLKPANVMVTDEGQRVKVLDFGLAKLAEAGPIDGLAEMPTEALTQEGLIVGTPHYMSPEQAKGETVDQRSDIFSLGVILFEMATGNRPFQGASSVELLSSVLKDQPPSVSDAKPELPRHLGRVIGRCLEKSPDDRYQTARDVFNELKNLTKESSGDSIVSAVVPAQPARNRSVAVVPFRAPPADTELTTLAEGLAEDVTTGLARFPYFSIVDGSAIDQTDSSTEKARELGVGYLLRGALRSAANLLRVNAQLVDVQTGAHLWAESYDLSLEDSNIFEIQDSLTDRIVAAVADRSGVLVRSLAAGIRDLPDDELTVDDWVIRAVAFQQNLNPHEHAAVRAGLEQMIEKHPNHAQSFAWLATLYSAEYTHQINPQEDSLNRWLEAAQRAVDLDPTCQEGWDFLASAHYFQRDLVAFKAAAERAISLNSRNTATIAYIGMQICYSGDWERGHQLVLEARSLNPNHPGWYYFPTFYNFYRQGRYEEALEVTKKINMPELHWTHMVTAIACGQLGRLEEARKALTELRNLGVDVDQLRPEAAKWMVDETLLDHIMDGLQKASAEAAT